MNLQELIDARVQSALDKAIEDMVAKGVAKALGAQLNGAAKIIKDAEPKPAPSGEQLPLTGVPPVVATMLPEPGTRTPRGKDFQRRRITYPSHVNVRVNPNYRGHTPRTDTLARKHWETCLQVLDNADSKSMNRAQLARDVAILTDSNHFNVSGAITSMLRKGQLVLAV